VEQVPGTPPTPLVSPQDASRFLMQATFGGSEADINHLSTIGYTVVRRTVCGSEYAP